MYINDADGMENNDDFDQVAKLRSVSRCRPTVFARQSIRELREHKLDSFNKPSPGKKSRKWRHSLNLLSASSLGNRY